MFVIFFFFFLKKSFYYSDNMVLVKKKKKRKKKKKEEKNIKIPAVVIYKKAPITKQGREKNKMIKEKKNRQNLGQGDRGKKKNFFFFLCFFYISGFFISIK